MKILHLFASPVFSGPAQNILELALAQRALGHDVAIAVDRKRTQLSAEEPIVPRLLAAGVLDESGLELSVKSSPVQWFRDARRLGQLECDVLHSHFSHDHFVAWLGKKTGQVLIRSLHAPRSLRRLMPPADAWTVPFAQMSGLRDLGETWVWPCMVGSEFIPSVDREARRAAWGISGTPVIGMVSTFQASRRHFLGLEAFRRLRDVRPTAQLVLVGDGVLEKDIREKVKSLGLEQHVVFAGYQAGASFVSWLQLLDQVWVLGLGNDFSGRAAAQAQACDVRVVAVPEGALVSWADEILENNDPEMLMNLSLRVSRNSNVIRLSPQENAAGMIALYERARQT